MEAHAVTYPVPGGAHCLAKRHRIMVGTMTPKSGLRVPKQILAIEKRDGDGQAGGDGAGGRCGGVIGDRHRAHQGAGLLEDRDRFPHRALRPRPLLLYAGFSNGFADAGPSPPAAPADTQDTHSRTNTVGGADLPMNLLIVMSSYVSSWVLAAGLDRTGCLSSLIPLLSQIMR